MILYICHLYLGCSKEYGETKCKVYYLGVPVVQQGHKTVGISLMLLMIMPSPVKIHSEMDTTLTFCCICEKIPYGVHLSIKFTKPDD